MVFEVVFLWCSGVGGRNAVLVAGELAMMEFASNKQGFPITQKQVSTWSVECP